jgi:predicted Zn-dependent protease
MLVRVTRSAALLVVLALAASGCGRYSINNIRSAKAFQDANKLYQKAEYKAAIERYEAAVQLNPDLGFAYFFLGNSYDNMYKPARKGEAENDAHLTKAAEYYRIGIDKLAQSAEPKEQEIRKLTFEYLIAAYGKDKLNDFDKAEPVAKELIAAEPGVPANYQLLGKLYEDEGRFEEAEAMYRKAVEVSPKDGASYSLLAAFYNRQGEFEKTIQAFQDRANVEPNNPEAWHTMGTYYQDKVFRDKRLSNAVALDYTLKGIAAEDKALALNKDYFEALTFKNILLRQRVLYEKDPAVRKQLLADADVLQKQAMEIQKKQNMSVGDAGGKGKK